MKWSLMELRKYQEQNIDFSEVLDLKKALLERDSTIIDLSLVKVDGFLRVEANDYLTHYHVETLITVPSTRSLEPVCLPLSFDVDEIFMTPEQFAKRDNLIPEEEILLLESQTLNLEESIIDNILLAIPMQVFTEEEKDTYPVGNDWVVLSEDDYNKQKESAQKNHLDPRLAKLSALFENEDSSADK